MHFKGNVIVFFYLCFISHVTSKNCFWNSENHYKQFSSKTPYNNVRGDIRDSLVKPEGMFIKYLVFFINYLY